MILVGTVESQVLEIRVPFPAVVRESGGNGDGSEMHTAFGDGDRTMSQERGATAGCWKG